MLKISGSRSKKYKMILPSTVEMYMYFRLWFFSLMYHVITSLCWACKGLLKDIREFKISHTLANQGQLSNWGTTILEDPPNGILYLLHADAGGAMTRSLSDAPKKMTLQVSAWLTLYRMIVMWKKKKKPRDCNCVYLLSSCYYLI